MRAAELLRALAYPFTASAIVLAMLFFYSLFLLNERAGLVGIGLLIIAVPAYLRYLVLLIEERALGRPARCRPSRPSASGAAVGRLPHWCMLPPSSPQSPPSQGYAAPPWHQF